MGRRPCCAREGLNRGAWTPLEDKMLRDYVQSHGAGKWTSLAKRAGLKRCGKSCRLRWLNYLRPDIKRGNITDDEEDLIIRLHKLLGNRWSLIAGRLPGRTDNEIKNYWNTNIVKKIQIQDGQHLASSSSTKRKPSSTRSRSAVLQNLTSADKPPNSEKLGSFCTPVIRTKARRCTKVFINAHLQASAGAEQGGIIMAVKAQAPPPSSDAKNNFNKTPTGHNNTVGPEPPSGGVKESLPIFPGEEGYLSGFMMDFEIEDKFLLDFLNTDFGGFEHEFIERVAEGTNGETNDEVGTAGVAQGTNIETNDEAEANHFSPNSCPRWLSHDDRNHADLGSITTLLDPALVWHHDN
ncbi:uncharacterized protein [Coffea arabica]|uniref:Uncharacterized protein isoform X1 n=1 Tax=Coffea arabica TaxID=13443 RepID=A0A6P6VR96_COFAR|nr:anthocyanin regulatory C1 protein-like isoform X1 [Coffea arabica]